MKMKMLIGVLIFLILINLATIGTFLYVRFSHHRPPMMPGFDDHLPPPPLMNIDEGQREKVMKLMEELQNETTELREKADKLERRTFELMEKTPASEDSIDQNLSALSSVRLELSRRFTMKLLGMKSFLTPEQQRVMFRSIGKEHHGPGNGPPVRPRGPEPGGRDFPPPGPPPDNE